MYSETHLFSRVTKKIIILKMVEKFEEVCLIKWVKSNLKWKEVCLVREFMDVLKYSNQYFVVLDI